MTTSGLLERCASRCSGTNCFSSERYVLSPQYDLLSPEDATEIERFAAFLRLVSEAERAGVPRTEAAFALYKDVFDPCDK